jgi:hypothetical protein
MVHTLKLVLTALIVACAVIACGGGPSSSADKLTVVGSGS